MKEGRDGVVLKEDLTDLMDPLFHLTKLCVELKRVKEENEVAQRVIDHSINQRKRMTEELSIVYSSLKNTVNFLHKRKESFVGGPFGPFSDGCGACVECSNKKIGS